MIYKKILILVAATCLSQATTFEQYRASFEKKQNHHKLKKGKEFIQKRCARCHINPNFVAGIYTEEKWETYFNKTKENITEEDIVKNRIYFKHQANEGMFKNLLEVLNDAYAKRFLTHNAKKEDKQTKRGYNYILNPPKAK